MDHFPCDISAWNSTLFEKWAKHLLLISIPANIAKSEIGTWGQICVSAPTPTVYEYVHKDTNGLVMDSGICKIQKIKITVISYYCIMKDSFITKFISYFSVEFSVTSFTELGTFSIFLTLGFSKVGTVPRK